MSPISKKVGTVSSYAQRRCRQAAAKGSTTLLVVVGLAISILMVIFGSSLITCLMPRYPVIGTLGAALIGWVAGATIASDAVARRLP